MIGRLEDSVALVLRETSWYRGSERILFAREKYGGQQQQKIALYTGNQINRCDDHSLVTE